MSGHAPGPWTADKYGDVRDEYGGLVAEVWDDLGDTARLIAAAPDLLEACEAMVDAARSGAKVEVGSPYYDLAIQAIAKAEGDS